VPQVLLVLQELLAQLEQREQQAPPEQQAQWPDQLVLLVHLVQQQLLELQVHQVFKEQLVQLEVLVQQDQLEPLVLKEFFMWALRHPLHQVLVMFGLIQTMHVTMFTTIRIG
jgi:hypothetical protein